MEVWSFATSAFEVLGHCFKDILNRVSESDKALVEEYLYYVGCLDKAGRHAIGEAVQVFSNLIVKKRELVLNKSSKGIPDSTKNSLLFSPVSPLNAFFLSR